MKMHSVRRLAYILSLFLLISTLAACHTTPPVAPSTDVNTPPPVEVKSSLTVGYATLSGEFHPFFARTATEREVSALVTLPLLDVDREGSIVLQGGIADCAVTENEDGTATYDFTLREDVKFSDGSPLTADDVIFSMYVLADPSYDGAHAFASLPIRGLSDYHAGVSPILQEKYAALADELWAAGPDATVFQEFTEAQHKAYWGDVLTAAGVMFVDEIIEYCLQNYADFLPRCQNNAVALGMYVWGYGTPNDDGSFTDAFGTTYDLKTAFPTKAGFWENILTAHNRDFSADGIDRDAAATPIADFLKKAFIAMEGPKDENEEERVFAIDGIEKTGAFSLRVTLTSTDTAIENLNIPVAPLHHYGTQERYDYQNNKFGFDKGDLSGVKAKTTPLGAGPYAVVGYENSTVTFKANTHYYKGCPPIETLLLKEVGDTAAALRDGAADVAAVAATEELERDKFALLAVAGTESAVAFNVARIDVSTLPPEITPYRNWTREIESLKLH